MSTSTSSAPALDGESVLPIEIQKNLQDIKVATADMLTWAYGHAEVSEEMRFYNACRCWSQMTGYPDTWLDEPIGETVDAIMEALWDEKKHPAYISRWEDKSTSAHRDLAKSEYQRLIGEWYDTMIRCVPDVAKVPGHVFDTITMADLWLHIRDQDIAITLTYLYGRHRFDDDFVPTQDIDDREQDMKGEEVRWLREYYKSFSYRQFKWWRKNHPYSDPYLEIRKKNNRNMMDERLMQFPWMSKYIQKDDTMYKGKTDTGRVRGYRFFRQWVLTAKEWDAKRRPLEPEAS
ncbi:MAG: hypothetical protein L6R38_005944 [Xanthoria sp. 2 TBL-2021]|nr:MAG: hypothetical protein L6R38_005944 [Xanthoria sp. 2 TBL-2021]